LLFNVIVAEKELGPAPSVISLKKCAIKDRKDEHGTCKKNLFDSDMCSILSIRLLFSTFALFLEKIENS